MDRASARQNFDGDAVALIQYHETDREFLKRTVAGAGRCLVPDSSKKGVRYTIGLPEGMKRDLPADRIRIKKEALSPSAIPHEAVTGCSFDAVVTGGQKDRVQVEIAQDEWNAQDGKKWFLYATVYSSPDGTGGYCMPEPGDSVRLHVPGREEDSFVMSAVHRETDAARQNPDCKSFKTKYGKEILFTSDSILMTNNQGMMVEMNDSEGIMITSDKDIVVDAKENLTISSNSASLLIAAEDRLQVRQGGTSMTLSGDIAFTGGEFRIQ